MATATMVRIAEIVPHPSGNGFGVKVGKHSWISGGAGPMGGGDIGRFPTEAAAKAEATRIGYQIAKTPPPESKAIPKAEVTPVTPKVTGNLYRWSNLREIVKTSKGERVTSLDVSDSPDFYFSPYNSRKQIGGGKSWLDNTYLRVILDRGKLTSAGWVKDPALKAEGAWRHIGKKADTDLARDYTLAIKGIEVDDIPAGKTLEDISAIVEFRLGRKVPVVASGTLKVAGEVTPVTTKGMAIPKAAEGMPEAGLQLDISGKTTPVMPKGKARYATASMDAFAKLERMKAEAKPKAATSAKPAGGRTLSHEDATELLAGLELRAEAIADRIYRGSAELEAMKETLDPRLAKLTALIPVTKEGRSEITHITKGQYRKVWGREPKSNILTADGKRVRWEYALDEIAQELHLEDKARAEGVNADEYAKGLIEDARDAKQMIAATEHELKSDEATLKAIDRLRQDVRAREGTVTSKALVASLAAGKPKPRTKAEAKAKGMLADEVQKLIAKVQASRTPAAIAMDNAILANRVLPLSKANVWAKHPNRVDIRGVDTPVRGRIVAGVAYADKGKKRLSRKHHKGFRKIKLT